MTADVADEGGFGKTEKSAESVTSSKDDQHWLKWTPALRQVSQRWVERVASLAPQPSWSSEHRSPARARRRAIGRSSVVLVATGVIIAMPWIFNGSNAAAICNATDEVVNEKLRAWLEDGEILVAYDCAMLFGMAIVVALSQLRWWLTSRYLVAVRWHLVLSWFVVASWTAVAQWHWCNVQVQGQLFELFCVGSITSQWLTWAWSLDLIRRHLVKLEKSFETPLGSHQVRWALRWDLVACVVGFANGVVILSVPSAVDICSVLFHVITPTVILTVMLVLVLVFRGFWLVHRYAVCEAKECASHADQKMAKRAIRVSRRLVFEAPFGVLPTMTAIVAQGFLWDRPEVWARVLLHVSNTTSVLLVARFLCLLSGIDLMDFAHRDKSLLEMPVCSSVSCLRPKLTRSAHWSSGNLEWDTAVQELARRGISLKALLRFYRLLGTAEVMPHYNPDQHSTEDVVRQAIIPLSRGTKYGDCALFTVLMHGRKVLPKTMVTHTWSNKFMHLVAAIVADALDEPEYQRIVCRLHGDELVALESELYWKGKLGETYWVCAFSVNQHAGICSAPSRPDPVTGEHPPSCGCGRPKFYSDTAPLRLDGQSICCEMNKFDDMMECLCRLRPSFSQLIAVDAEFELFHRAWCVAELHQASTLHLPQRMRLLSADNLRQHQSNLTTLRVEDMQASNPKDRDMILAKIADRDAFNQGLQQLLFAEGGLLQCWCDGFQTVAVLGEVARRGYARTVSRSTDSVSSDSAV